MANKRLKQKNKKEILLSILFIHVICSFFFLKLSAINDPVAVANLDESQWSKYWGPSTIGIKDLEFHEESKKIEELLGQSVKPGDSIAAILEIGVFLRVLIRSPKPETHVYSEKEHQVIREQFMQIGYLVQKSFPHSSRDISKGDLNKARKCLLNAQTNAEETKWAKKTLLHAKIPWRLLERLSLYLFKHLGEDNKQIPSIILQSWEALRTDFKTLLQHRDNLLRVYVNTDLVPLEALNLPKEEEAFSDIPTFMLVGGYYKDQSYWQKLQRELNVLDHFGGKSFRDKEARYAFFRLITVIGETGKYLSPYMKKRLPHDIWKISAKIRDSFHNPREYKRFFDVVEKESRNTFYGFIPELKRFRAEITPAFEAYDSFETLKEAYHTAPRSFTQSINLPFLEGCLTNKTEQELLQTLESRITSIEKPIELMRKMLTGDKGIDRHLFEKQLSSVPSLTKGDKKHLIETVKKKTSGKEITQKRIEKCLKILEKQHIPDEKEARNKALKIIREFGKYIKKDPNGNKIPQWDILKKELILLGIRDLTPWENTLIKFVRPAHEPGKHRVVSIINNILQATNAIEKAMQKNKNLPETWRLDHFWNDPFLSSAIDFLFGCFREESTILIQELQNPTFVFPQDRTPKLTSMTIDALKSQVESAKRIFHLHETQDIDSHGVTPIGWKFMTYTNISNFMEGWGTVIKYGAKVPAPQMLKDLKYFLGTPRS